MVCYGMFFVLQTTVWFMTKLAKSVPRECWVFGDKIGSYLNAELSWLRLFSCANSVQPERWVIREEFGSQWMLSCDAYSLNLLGVLRKTPLFSAFCKGRLTKCYHISSSIAWQVAVIFATLAIVSVEDLACDVFGGFLFLFCFADNCWPGGALLLPC